MRSQVIALICAAGFTVGLAPAETLKKTTHPGGEEERLLGKGDASDVRFGNFPSQDITFLSQVPISAFGLGAADVNDCWG